MSCNGSDWTQWPLSRALTEWREKRESADPRDIDRSVWLVFDIGNMMSAAFRVPPGETRHGIWREILDYSEKGVSHGPTEAR